MSQKMIAFSVSEEEKKLFDKWAKNRGYAKAADLVKAIFYGQIPRVAPERIKKAFEQLHFIEEE